MLPVPDFTPSTHVTGKRKRDEEAENNINGAATNGAGGNGGLKSKQLGALIKDIVDVLRRSAQSHAHRNSCVNIYSYSHDVVPSFLDLPLPTANLVESASKRAKLSESAEDNSIASRVVNQIYSNLEDFVADVNMALSTMDGQSDNQSYTNEAQGSNKQARAARLKESLGNILLRELAYRPSLLGSSRADKSSDQSAEGVESDSIGKVVLTLYGSAPQPKQLFSSLQASSATVVQGAWNLQDGTPNSSDRSTQMSLDPSKESALPNGISTTKVVPVHCIGSNEEKQRVPTIGEIFPPPYTLAPLNPPRQSKHTTTRSSSVNWFNPAEATITRRGDRRDSYPSQPMTTAQWLAYGIPPIITQFPSPESKRKQRERALSIGEPKPQLSPEELVALENSKDAHRQAKEDALYCSTYSSFGPQKDNAASIVPEKTKNKLWWAKFGQYKYEDSSELSMYEFDYIDDDDISNVRQEPIRDEEIEEAIRIWKPQELPPDLKKLMKSDSQDHNSNKNIEEILNEISGLLETLHSYQRVRNLSLNASARTSAGQKSELASILGSPTSPSTGEFDVYSTLKSQLTLMISMLPPYAVAKLDGEKLKALNVTTRIHVESKNIKGTMEDDELTAKSKQTAISAAAGAAARVNSANGNPAARNSYYHQPAASPAAQTPRTNFSAQTAYPRSSSSAALYPPSTQYSARPASNNYSSSSYRPSHSSQQMPPSSSGRNPYASQPYGGQPSPAHPIQYTNGYRPPSASNMHPYSQQYVNAQQAAVTPATPGAQYQRPSQPGYQVRAQTSSNHAPTSASLVRTGSPGVGVPAQTQRFSDYGSAAPVNQGRPQFYQQLSHYATQGQSSAQANGTVAPLSTASSGDVHQNMSAEEQVSVMGRQKAQLVEGVQRQGSGTPQPANGYHGGHGSGATTPVLAQPSVSNAK